MGRGEGGKRGLRRCVHFGILSVVSSQRVVNTYCGIVSIIKSTTKESIS